MASKIIKGKVSIPEFDTDIEVDVTDAQYEAYDKELPKNLPKETVNKETITWFNNFGVRHKNGTNERTVPHYKVRIQMLPEGEKLCAYYNNAVNDIPVQDAGQNKIEFTLDVGDPPIGIYP
jgi:hypothetical protein